MEAARTGRRRCLEPMAPNESQQVIYMYGLIHIACMYVLVLEHMEEGGAYGARILPIDGRMALDG